MSIADVPFEVEQEAASIPGLDFIGLLAHLAAQEKLDDSIHTGEQEQQPGDRPAQFFRRCDRSLGRRSVVVPLAFPAGSAVALCCKPLR